MRAPYDWLPEEVRRCLRPFNLLEEIASFLPDPAQRRTLYVAEAGRRLQRLHGTRYPVRRASGRAAGSDAALTTLLAVDDLSFRYWTRELFAAPPHVEELGTVPALAIRAAARRQTDADLALWQTPWPLTVQRWAARVPSWVPLWLDTDRSLAEVIAGDRSGRAARKNDVRRVLRLDLRPRVVTDAASYERFREELYLPYVRSRFDDLAIPVAAHAFRHVRRRGCLLLLERDGCAVSGALLERGPDHATIRVFGVSTDAAVPSGVALEACYYHAIRWAVEQRIPRLALGSSRPILSDGVMRYKRKWGACIGTSTSWDAFALCYRNTPGTRAALAATPLVLDLGARRLGALAGPVPADGDAVAHVGRLDAPGLAEIACLVDREVVVPARRIERQAELRIVPTGSVWPPEAEMAVA